MFSPKPGQRNCPRRPAGTSSRGRSSAAVTGPCRRRPVPQVVAHVVAAERQHRHRVAAHHADLAGRRGGGLRAERRAEEHAVLPVERLEHQRDVGPPARAEDDRADRHALRVLPRGRERRALRRRRGEAAVRVRRRLAAPGVQGRPCQSMAARAAGRRAPPTTRAVGPQRDVREDRVARDRLLAFGLVCELVPGTTPKNPASGLTAQSRPSWPPASTRCRRRRSRSSSPSSKAAGPASRGSSCRTRSGRRRDVGHLALGALDAEDEHVLGEPALAPPEVARDPERQALLAEQRVAAVAGADAPDRVVLREVADEAAVGSRSAVECRPRVKSSESPS